MFQLPSSCLDGSLYHMPVPCSGGVRASVNAMSLQHKFTVFGDFLPHKGVDVLMTDVHAAVDVVLRM